MYKVLQKPLLLDYKAMCSLIESGTLYLFILIRGRYTRRVSGFERETKKDEREELRWTDNGGTRAVRREGRGCTRSKGLNADGTV